MTAFRRRWRVEATLDRVRELAREVEAACAEARVSKEIGARVRLCVAEAATNAVRHAYGSAASGPVEVYLRIGVRAVAVEVTDSGKPMPVGIRVQPPDVDPSRPHALPEGGMGLYLIQSSTDRWAYRTRSGRNTLRMLLRLRADGAARTRRAGWRGGR